MAILEMYGNYALEIRIGVNYSFTLYCFFLFLLFSLVGDSGEIFSVLTCYCFYPDKLEDF